MPLDRVAPHLAEPRLTYADPKERDAFAAAVMRGFHLDYVPEHWVTEFKVTEWDRNFGFRVENRWVATCGAFSRRLTVPGAQLPVAAVSIVTVAPSYRRRGLLNQMMRHQLADIRRRGREPVALLWASESLIYGRYGYGHAAPRVRISGETRATGYRPEVELGAGSVDEVTREEFQSVAVELHAQLLTQRPGGLDRPIDWWDGMLYDPESLRRGAGPLRFAVHFDGAGQADGYAWFRIQDGAPGADPGKEVLVCELDAADPAAYAALWRFLLNLDLVRTFVRRSAPVDEPLRHLVADQRAVKTEVLDGTYLRLVDLPAALQARSYAAVCDLNLAVADPLLPNNSGCYRLRADLDNVTVERSTAAADVTLSTRELAACYLGGTSVTGLHRAGLVAEHRRGAVAELAAALSWPVPPFAADFF